MDWMHRRGDDSAFPLHVRRTHHMQFPRPVLRFTTSLVLTCGGVAVASAQRPLPTWTRGAVCYEIFVRSFFDSDGDGIGDFNGMTQKLDYINDGNPDTQRDLGA